MPVSTTYWHIHCFISLVILIIGLMDSSKAKKTLPPQVTLLSVAQQVAQAAMVAPDEKEETPKIKSKKPKRK